MIEIKIKGSNAQKRTVIDSLRCEFIKEKDKLYMMRFKSLPNHKRAPRNSARISIPSISKVLNEEIHSKSFQNPLKQKEHISKSYLDSSIQQIEPQLLLKYYQSDDQSPKNQKTKYARRVKSTISVNEQIERIPRYYKTIQDDDGSKNRHSSLRDYINNFIHLKQSYHKSDKEIVKQITSLNSQKIQHYRRQKNFKPVVFVKKDEGRQSEVEELFNGQLSPNICRIDRLQAQELMGNRNILKRFRQQRSIQNSLVINRNDEKNTASSTKQKAEKVQSLSYKQKVEKYSAPTLFKNSLGPWRSSGFDFKNQFKNGLSKDFLS